MAATEDVDQIIALEHALSDQSFDQSKECCSGVWSTFIS